VAEAIHQAAKTDRHCRVGIAKTEFGMDEHKEFAEHQY